MPRPDRADRLGRFRQPVPPPSPLPAAAEFIPPVMSEADLASIEEQEAINAARMDVESELTALKQALLDGGVITEEELAAAQAAAGIS